MRLTVRMVEGVGVARFEPAAGRSTAGARIVLVRRGEGSIVPDRETRLLPGDVLLVIASRGCSPDALVVWSRTGGALVPT